MSAKLKIVAALSAVTVLIAVVFLMSKSIFEPKAGPGQEVTSVDRNPSGTSAATPDQLGSGAGVDQRPRPEGAGRSGRTEPGPAAPDYSERKPNELLSELDVLINTVTAVQSSDLRRLIDLGRRVDPVSFARYTKEKLAANDLLPQERSNVIWLATKLNSTEMVPVWQGLLTREYPAFPNEEKDWSVWMLDHRNENLRLMQAEQLRAVSGLSAMLENSENSRRFLNDFVLNEVSVPGDATMLRLDAVRHMQQHNANSLLRLTKRLKGDDPLRQQLTLYAKVKRGEN